MKYQTILFDFDGCVVNSLPIWLKSFRKTFDSLGVNISDRDIIDKAFHRWDAKPELQIPDVEAFKYDLYANFDSLQNEIHLHEGFLEVVKSLREKGIKTAIVTSTLRPTLDRMLTHLACDTLFDTTLAWEDTSKNKPDPDPLLLAMERLESKPEETIMIGDNEVDIIAGKAADVTGIWYYPKINELYYPQQMFAHYKPAYTIKHFKELFDII